MYCSFIYHFIFSNKSLPNGIVLLMQVVRLSELNNLQREIKRSFWVTLELMIFTFE